MKLIFLSLLARFWWWWSCWWNLQLICVLMAWSWLIDATLTFQLIEFLVHCVLSSWTGNSEVTTILKQQNSIHNKLGLPTCYAVMENEWNKRWNDCHLKCTSMGKQIWLWLLMQSAIAISLLRLGLHGWFGTRLDHPSFHDIDNELEWIDCREYKFYQNLHLKVIHSMLTVNKIHRIQHQL